MTNLKIYRRRIEQFAASVMASRYGATVPMTVQFTYDKSAPIPLDKLKKASWKPIKPGTNWGELWASAWFRVSGSVPADFKGKNVVALIDTGSESCIFENGVPIQGLTDSRRTPGDASGKRRVQVATRARGGESVDYLLEAGANSLFGYHGKHEFVFAQADLAIFYPDVWQVALDIEFLLDLARTLPEKSVRGRKLWRGLNEAANAWNGGDGLSEVQKICAALLKPKADSSAPTVWSVGHAHIDLGWLWPVRESRRKAGRTFSTALTLMKEYPDYVFGASQPQAYEWVKDDYPALYARIKKAVKDGTWECQGAMWVEPDMNITSGESLVRQLLYGKRFFRQEFGVEINNLWLPDVFGYSAALPQLLKLAGVDYFMTQKISWNETNRFPHHSFIWEGIDGTGIRTHFLPMDTYNARTTPEELVRGMEQFAQADVADDWLNLFGIGDGGGGPSRKHIEYVRRAADTEGLPRTKMAPSTDFFARFGKVPENDLPRWRGELYLELHRGTYTTQALMKKLNRRLELGLRDAEFFAALSGLDQRTEFQAIWKDVLLHQFHDILPGSSITRVYDDAHAVSFKHLETLQRLVAQSLRTLHGTEPTAPQAFVLHNTLSWDRMATVAIPADVKRPVAVRDATGGSVPTQPIEGGVLIRTQIPSMGHTMVKVVPGTKPEAKGSGKTKVAPTSPSVSPVTAANATLENRLLRITLADDGTISSIFDKEHHREVLEGPANQLLLWEDLPYSWDAWDISHYYRETTPVQATLSHRKIVESGPLRAAFEQDLTVGSSTISQRIELEADSRLVRIHNKVHWDETSKQLRVQARPAIQTSRATYEIQFGTVSRPTHANTSWDQAQFEVAGQRFADMSQTDYGIAILNDCKYGHYIRDGIMDLTLLRSPSDPDPKADRGDHEFTFGYFPHPGSWESSSVLESSHELNVPVVIRGTALKNADSQASEFSVTGGTVEIETVKQSEDGDDLILRLYETRGTTANVCLQSRRKWSTIQEVNLLEEDPKRVSRSTSSGGDGFASAADLKFGPYQIRTFRATFK